MPFVRNGQFLTTFCSAWCQYASTIGGRHSLTETVLVAAATVVGLKRSFHNVIELFIVCLLLIRGAKLATFLLLTKSLLLFFLLHTLFFTFILYLCSAKITILLIQTSILWLIHRTLRRAHASAWTASSISASTSCIASQARATLSWTLRWRTWLTAV